MDRSVDSYISNSCCIGVEIPGGFAVIFNRSEIIDICLDNQKNIIIESDLYGERTRTCEFVAKCGFRFSGNFIIDTNDIKQKIMQQLTEQFYVHDEISNPHYTKPDMDGYRFTQRFW